MAKASVIIVAGGSGSRMGGGTKKEFLDIEGKPVLFRALDPFLKCGLFGSAVIVIKEGLEDEAEKLITPFLTPGQKDTVRCVTGGRTRQESVLKGLLALKDESPDIVLIHDGARPWITEKIITDVYNKVVAEGAAIPVIPSVNALKEIDSNGKIIKNVDRNRIVGAQTPQGFRYRGILDAHLRISGKKADSADDAEVFSISGGEVHTVQGDIRNKKITYREDIEGQT